MSKAFHGHIMSQKPAFGCAGFENVLQTNAIDSF